MNVECGLLFPNDFPCKAAAVLCLFRKCGLAGVVERRSCGEIRRRGEGSYLVGPWLE